MTTHFVAFITFGLFAVCVGLLFVQNPNAVLLLEFIGIGLIVSILIYIVLVART